MKNRIITMSKCDKYDLSSAERFCKLWTCYEKELSEYSQRLKNDPASQSDILSMWTNPNIESNLIYCNGEIIGFLLLGVNDNKHECSDLFIAEFYITKSCQSQGIGKEVIRKLIKRKRGAFCLFILKQNKKAFRFWDSVFAENQYINTSERYFCGCTPDDCVFKMFEPEKSL